MNVTDDLKKRIDEMPEGQPYLAGAHDPELWKYLCLLDAGQHRRDDGCILVSNTIRTVFTWVRCSSEQIMNATKEQHMAHDNALYRIRLRLTNWIADHSFGLIKHYWF